MIISDEMTRELGLAAKRGMDVRVINAKQMLCDEECATVGTIKMDYRE